MALTDRDRTELHTALAEYLEVVGLTDAAESVKAFSADPARQQLHTDAAAKLSSCALPRRWNTLRRLNLRNTELERQVKALQAEIQTLNDPTLKKGSTRDLLPMEPERYTLRGHRDSLTAVCFHPFDVLAYTASDDSTVKVWDVEANELIRTLKGHADSVNDLAVEPTEGKLLATGSTDTAVKIYDAIKGESAMRTLYGHEEAVSVVRWLGDASKTLISGGRECDVRIWNVDQGVMKAKLLRDGWVRAIAVHPSGSLIASGGNDEKITISGISSAGSSHTSTIPAHSNVIQCICFSTAAADEVLIDAHGSSDLKTYLKERKRKGLGAEGGRFIASGGRDKNVKIHDAVAGTEIMCFTEHDNWVRGVAFSRLGKVLISVSDDGTMRLLDIVHGRCTRKIVAHRHFVTSLAFHPTKYLAITGSADQTAKVWASS